MSETKKPILTFCIIILVFLPIMADQLNGFMQTELGISFSVSQIIKSVITVILLVVTASVSFHRFLQLLLIISLFPLTVLTSLYTDSTRLTFLADDLIFFTKILTFPISFLFFEWLFAKYPVLLTRLYRPVYRWLCGLFFGAILISPLGLGITQYGVTEEGVSFGYRGYFIAGNEVSALFIILFAFWMFDLYYFRKNILYITAGSLLGLMVAGLIVTKTTMASATLLLIAIPFTLYFYFRNSPSALGYIGRFVKSLSFIVVLVLAVFVTLFKDTINANVDRFSENYERAGSIGTFLLSGRNDRFEDSRRLFAGYNAPEMLFGAGWNAPQQAIQAKYSGWGSAEVDYLDLLVSMGLVGLAAIYIFWGAIYVKIIRAFFAHRNMYCIPVLLAFTVIFFNSFFSGHVLYSALVGYYLGFFSAIIIIKNKLLCISS